MIEIGLVIAVALAIGGFLKSEEWFPNRFIPLAIVMLAVVFNLGNALLFGDGDLLEAGRLALIEGLGAIGIHSSVKNTLQKRDD